MILVADSGSTKCDWILHSQDSSQLAKTMGFNPFFHSTDLIVNELLKNEILVSNKNNIQEIYYYGAGCSSTERNQVISLALSQVFPNATTVKVGHDLEGAALATTPEKPGIACILGTGSNSCYYDGNIVQEAVPALGYILGDEGSGSFFGKIILKKYLYNQLPEDLHQEIENQFQLSKETIFESVYNLPNPNVYLASFMKFVSARKEHPFLRDMLYEGLAIFATNHIWCYQNFRDVPVHFVGSIAYYFKDILEEVAKNHRFTIGNVVKKPVDALVDFHRTNKTINI